MDINEIVQVAKGIHDDLQKEKAERGEPDGKVEQNNPEDTTSKETEGDKTKDGTKENTEGVKTGEEMVAKTLQDSDIAILELMLEEQKFLRAKRRGRSLSTSKPRFTRTPMGEYIPPIGGQPLTQLAFSYPGPSTYSPRINLTKPAAPEYSLVARPKDNIGRAKSPAPDTYDTSADLVWPHKTKTLKEKLETCPYGPTPEGHLTCSLGAAAYKVEYYKTGKHAPKPTLSSRYKKHIVVGPPNNSVQPCDTQGFQSPGPNEYDPDSPHWGTGTMKSFGLADGRVQPVTSPGPAQYKLKPKDKGPYHSFGIRLDKSNASDGPGPGAYDLGTTVGKAVSKSLSSRHAVINKQFVPSPNTYRLPDSFKDAPKHSMTYRAFERDIVIEESPGPAVYKPNNRNLHKSPEYICRTPCKPCFPDILNYPEYSLMENQVVGPGTYEQVKEFKDNDKPSYTMRKKTKTPQSNVPGPAHYNISIPCRPDSNKAPEFSMAIRLDIMTDDAGPGPAAYNPRPKTCTPSYSMTDRPKIRQFCSTPAPNRYRVNKGQTCKGTYDGGNATFKGRASPYVYSGFRGLNNLVQAM